MIIKNTLKPPKTKKMKTFRNLLLAILLLIAYDISAQSNPWTLKQNAGGEFVIHDLQYGLDVIGIEPNSSANAIYIGSNGVIGFGTTSPYYHEFGSKVDVRGDIQIQDNNAFLIVDNTATGSNSGVCLSYNGIYKGWFFYDESVDYVRLNCDYGGFANQLVLHSTGAVCVGTATVATGYLLSVDGKIACEEVLVKDDGNWPDHVFSEGYNLMDLKELEKSIQKNNHLPGIPSAKDVEENGFQLANMQKRVLEKVEELTLYTIDQGKIIEEQGKLIDELQRKIEALEKQTNN